MRFPQLRLSIRFEITAFFLAVFFVANVSVSFVAIQFVRRVYQTQIQNRVRLDLNSAREVYVNDIESIESFLQGLARAHEHSKATPQPAGHVPEAIWGSQGRLDILHYIPAKIPAESDACLIPSLAIVARAMDLGRPVSGTIILPQALLEKESPDLARRARFVLQETPAARPTNRNSLTDGMALAAAVPLKVDGKITGLFFGARLLNRRYEIVDRIKEDVYQGETHEGKDIGTATIFQGDVRISTNVRNSEGARAIGTRLSEEVYDQVIGQGRTWADQAFVVNNWYITAYEPIRNPEGTVIGALYVGLLEEPFRRMRTLLIGGFIALMALTSLASLGLVLFVTRLILRPIGQIADMSRRVMQGDLTARVDIRPAGEMGELCATIDQMAETMMEREEQLKEATSRQVSQSEKLASIGRLSAGIAHEINNPLGSVLTMAHLLKEQMEDTEDNREAVDMIIRETRRVSEIVRGLLDFSREQPAVQSRLDIAQPIHDTVRLLKGDKHFRHIDIQTQMPEEPLPEVMADRNQMQQVFLNLALNACEAMPEGGKLVFRARAENHRVKIDIQDTGTGIPEADLAHIFEPFFTTKPAGKGTGLGLSVSYGIVEKQGGHIQVESQMGRGTVFTVVLPEYHEEK